MSSVVTAAAERLVSGAFGRERLFYKGAAIFLALVLWLVVSAEEPAEHARQLFESTGVRLHHRRPHRAHP